MADASMLGHVGVDRCMGQYMVHRGLGIQYARTVMRLPEPNKWDKDKLAEIGATPCLLHVPTDPEVVFKDKKDAEKVDAHEKFVVYRKH